MRSLPHIAVACGAIWVTSRVISVHDGSPRGAGDDENASTSPGNPASADASATAEPVDYRLVAFGSLLPDMVDRALRARFSRFVFEKDQHLLGHTLLLNLPLLCAGIYLARTRRDRKLLAVSAGAATHLLVDPVVRSPRTLLWPLLGLRFPAARGLSPRLTLVTQLAAAALILGAAFHLQRQGRLSQFIYGGRL